MPKVTKEKVLRDIEQYCEVNNLDKEVFVTEILYKGFMLSKYGERPSEVTVQTKETVQPIVYEIPQVFLEGTKEAHEEPVVTDTVEVPVEVKKRLRKRKIEVK